MDVVAANFEQVDRPSLPAESPLEMPVQSLWHCSKPRSDRTRLPSAPRGMAFRRLLVIGGAVLLTAAAANEMYKVLTAGTLTVLAILVLLLFVALFAWIALALTSAICGFACMLGRGEQRLGISSGGPLPDLSVRTALLMPTYNEATARIMAGLQAIYESLAATGQLDRFHLFILSDTTDPDIWIAEEAAFLALRARTGSHDRIFYRHRRFNTERKAGNISDWVRHFGGAYPQMMILDADSVMSGEAIVRLAAA